MTDPRAANIDKILTAKLETDEDYAALAELVEDESIDDGVDGVK